MRIKFIDKQTVKRQILRLLTYIQSIYLGVSFGQYQISEKTCYSI
ncbi:hypothetical protein HDEF_0368 [Candidatus Hamiltonella defensa 5AT (Acyrthosiphon pisum)]|uniref:Uncharacterized protein n=1 Tax=Hamiltonella defensa subsp. Acyrthosiphon pisum (strain 5AT) TaxID=572265 RepID=C4K3I2_HAMD5|nr:hypothetical protein HDEF_0368 [Candidatus Hamiltonella defensa 5AT (Acyrthosiphon pisum)]